MRLFHVLVLLALLLPVGCGGGGGGTDPTAPNDFTIPASLSLTADNLTLATGTAALVSTTGHYTGSADQDLTASVVLSSSDAAVADPVGGGSLVLAGNPGTAVITATWTGTGGDQVTGTLDVTVTAATATEIIVSPADATISEGATRTFAATANFSDATSQALLNEVVTWTSDDATIATVTTSGLATGLKAGAVNINAAFGGQTGSALLTVEPILVGIELTADPAHITQNESAQFLVTEVYSDGSKGVLGSRTEEAVFSLEDGPITAVISNQPGSKGLLTGVTADGNLTVTATLGSFTDDYQLVIFTPAE